MPYCSIYCSNWKGVVDVRDGSALSRPASQPLCSYPLRIEESDILVQMGHIDTPGNLSADRPCDPIDFRRNRKGLCLVTGNLTVLRTSAIFGLIAISGTVHAGGAYIYEMSSASEVGYGGAGMIDV